MSLQIVSAIRWHVTVEGDTAYCLKTLACCIKPVFVTVADLVAELLNLRTAFQASKSRCLDTLACLWAISKDCGKLNLDNMTLSPEEEALLGTVDVPTEGVLKIAGPSYQSARAAQEVLQAS